MPTPATRSRVGVVSDEGRDHPVYAGGARPFVAPHPFPRDREEIRMMDEVVEVIKPAVGIIDRPLVQLGLHPSYP